MQCRTFRSGRGRSVIGALGLALSLGLLSGSIQGDEAEAAERPTGTSSPAAPRTAGAQEDRTAASEEEALDRAESSGEKVEILALRGETREVYATPNGHLEAVEHLRPVRARVDGGWRPVDTALAVNDGMVAPKVATLDVAFSGGGDVPMVRMSHAGRELALSWPGELPRPVLDGPTATYPEVLPGVDLRLSAEVDGFTQLLVVKSAEAAANPELEKLRLSVATAGVRVEETAVGGLAAVDNGARSPVFEASTPMMWDSSKAAPEESPAADGTASDSVRQGTAGEDGTPASGLGDSETTEPGAGESGKLARIEVDVPASADELVLTPDREVLRGDDTVYPVFIDPEWHTARASSWTMASKYWANAPQWKFNGKSTEGLGYCEWSYCNPYDTKRLFYQIPTTAYTGKTILSAEFVVRNTWSASCSAREVELWRTKAINSSTTWNSQSEPGFWIDKLGERSFAYGFDGCAAADAEFNVKSAVQMAADKRWPTATFGLRAGNESDRYAWKRFSDDAFLRVNYNRPPPQIRMTQLLMRHGGTCQGPDTAPYVRTLDSNKIYANTVTDPDGDAVSVEFQAAWDAGDGKGTIVRWRPARTTAKASGENFGVSLPTSIPEHTPISWYARAYDGEQYSPWSSAGSPTSCYFIYDGSAPAAPRVTSTEYPASESDDPDAPWLDGVGQYGSFTMDAPDTDVTRYRYAVNGDPATRREVSTADGAPRVVKILPAKPGLNFVVFETFDRAGRISEPLTYQFRVKAGQPERATWQLNEEAGATASEGSAPERVAQLHGGARPGAAGALGTGLKLDGTTGYADTDIPIVDTDRGFTVSAWANLDTVPDGAAVIAAQPGNHRPGFELYYSSAYDRWVFNQYTSDSPEAGIVRAMAAQPGGVRAGEWTHLVGSYDSVAQRLRLYVNGDQVAETAHTAPWNARRGLMIGAGSYSGTPGSFFPGTIDELQVFDKGIAAEEVARLYAKQRIGDPGRPAKTIFALDEAADATQVGGQAGVLPARLHGGAKAGTPGVSGKALSLDGVDDYAHIGAPHVNSSRSFAVSMWAKLPQTKPSRPAVALSQGGTHKAGFELYYSAAYDRWVLNQHTADAPDAGAVRVMQPEGAHAHGATWTHLVGVHDTVADTLTLYVNGRAAGSVKLAGAWYAGGPMFLGAGSYEQTPGNHFPGEIDDVRLFDRPVAAGEVQQLFKQSPLLKGRWNFETATGTPATSPDATAQGNSLTLRGSAKIGVGQVDDGALNLNEGSGYAETSRVPADTSGSFTVTAWARSSTTLDPEKVKSAAVVSMEGNYHSGFTLRYVPETADTGRWEIALPDRDSSAALTTKAGSSAVRRVNEWNHLALAYDGFAKQATLYVNGQPLEVGCPDNDGDGRPDDPTCTEELPTADNALTFAAIKSLQVGRAKTAGIWGEYWPGSIDDVWTFQGALTDSQITRLASSHYDIPTEVPAA